LKKIIIAIDGWSSCGKSTLAKDLAHEIEYIYIDTGAMYRAVTYHFLQHQINFEDSSAINAALEAIQVYFEYSSGQIQTFLNGKNVEGEIRQMYVSEQVSHVAAISAVRAAMVKQQQLMGERKGIEMDGRDMGTVVFPKAELKLFLTADIETRIRRRYEELRNKGAEVSWEGIAVNLSERDRIDSTREDSPLQQAEDAILFDNTNISKEEQLAMLLALAKLRIRT